MQKLPIGIQDFEKIRRNNYIYVDKTKQILQLIENGECYFLSRPRRFGKSLTISTLEAMFKGQAELFKGLYAEEWVKEQAKHPNPVIKLDMNNLDSYETKEKLNKSLINDLKHCAYLYKLNVTEEEEAKAMFKKVIYALYEQFASVVVLIDEYDKPMTDNIDNLEKVNEMREILRSFYSLLKGCKEVKFVMFTGVSKFSKSGVFSGLNNLSDISMDRDYSDIVGYTQKELENNFGDWIEKNSKEISLSREDLLKKIKKHYDGFSFDGKVRVYNAFSVLNFFSKGRFGNYWYISGLPSFLAKYFKKHGITNPDKFRHIEVESTFADEHEIESSTCESFLYQAGYLTIEKWESKDDKEILTLDYPNLEVLGSINSLYLKDIYHIENYLPLGNALWNAIKTLKEDGNVEEIVAIFNSVLEKIPYIDFPVKEKEDNYIPSNRMNGESWYRSLFVVLLRGGAGVSSFQESFSKDGRADLVIPFEDKIIIIEFKFAKSSKEVDKKRAEGQEQVTKYAESYKNELIVKNSDEFLKNTPHKGAGKKIITVVLVADNEKKQVVL